ncbi:hypothetical protein X793_05600 [Dehalococcoides mccartyi CG4]|uniref:hypothetical protein n=1 Tax=Dehalococcoides mccartyi TaxID=61435 RepID=UPI0004E0A82D|nr:hypothetical protein [Dehalococcoides mccartyi]AII60224.1 hypothetical protein X793_05600 [Dehalococcoides mccartyi CG4]
MSIKNLWETGKLWEVFGFPDNSFNSIQLGNKYAELINITPTEYISYIDETFSILNAPTSRHIYYLCRQAMETISFDIGKPKFLKKEQELWNLIWAYCSNGWREPTKEVIESIKVQVGLSHAPIKPKEKTSDELVQELVNLIKSLDHQGQNKNQITEALTREGVPFTTAVQFVDSYFKSKKKSQSGCINQIIGWVVIGLIIWIISAFGNCDKSSTESTINNDPAPTVLQKAGTGSIAGKVFFKDGTSSTAIELFLFKTNESRSYKWTRANSSGYYTFESIPVGTYEIYVTANPNLTIFTGLPNATLSVNEYQTTYVIDIFISKPA